MSPKGVNRMKTRSSKSAFALGFLAVPLMLGTAFAQDNQEIYNEIADEVAEIRELELLDPLEVDEKSRDELREETREDLEEDYPLEEREDDQRVLVAFGLLNPEDDLGELFVDLLGEQVAGYYDPETDEMVVVRSGDGDGDELSVSDRVTFAHEAVHALQDQHFDLEIYTDIRIEGTSDESLAITALIEGDATLAQIDYILSDVRLARLFLDELESNDVSTESLDRAPPILVATLLFPYTEGQVFAQYLFDEGGWDLINEAYENPPTTTEQILHPEKYLDGEGGIDVRVPDLSEALGDEWRTLDDDTMGQFLISVVLSDADMSEDQVQVASEGWGGDAYTVVANDDDAVIAWSTEWDTEEDAAEFATALAVREGFRLDADPEAEGDSVLILADEAVVQIVLDGTAVTYVQAPDGKTLEAVLEALGRDPRT